MDQTSSTTIFDIIIWAGAAMTVAGLFLLLWCIIRVIQAKRAGLSDDELRAKVHKVVPVNLGALCLSVLGLMMVIIGVFMS
ncbi:MAG: hypothetical protein ABJL99_03210 [Aliishimia sp.]